MRTIDETETKNRVIVSNSLISSDESFSTISCFLIHCILLVVYILLRSPTLSSGVQDLTKPIAVTMDYTNALHLVEQLETRRGQHRVGLQLVPKRRRLRLHAGKVRRRAHSRRSPVAISAAIL